MQLFTRRVSEETERNQRRFYTPQPSATEKHVRRIRLGHLIHYKICHSLIAICHSDLFKYSNSISLPTRLGGPKRVTPIDRLNKLLNSFFFYQIHLWNALPPSVTSIFETRSLLLSHPSLKRAPSFCHIQLLNSLPPSVTNAPSISSFKKICLPLIYISI